MTWITGRRSRLLCFVVAPLLAGALLACSSYSHTSRTAHTPISEVRYVMGTLLDISVYASSEGAGRDILNETFKVAENLDSLLSTYQRESVVSQFNRDTDTTAKPVPNDVCELVRVSQTLSLKTNGAFDISVRPLVELWHTAAKRGYPPTPGEVAHATSLMGPSALSLSPPCRLGKRSPQVAIETGGIGKGFAVDKMVALLKERGVQAAFINFGRSSLAAVGAPPGEQGWPVTVELADGSRDGSITIRDETLSVSRARGTPFVVAGVSYAHIFDPSSGRPIRTSRGAAIRGPSATDGEAFVKYLVIRGAPATSVASSWGATEWLVKTDRKLTSSPGFFKLRSP